MYANISRCWCQNWCQTFIRLTPRQGLADGRQNDVNAGNIFWKFQWPFTRFFIIFTNFFLIAVSTRFFALLSIRAALLIGSRCVVIFAIFFFLSIILRLGTQIHYRQRAET